MARINLEVDGLLDAIDWYIKKADEDLEERLVTEGYAAVAAAVVAVNEIEDALTDALNAHTDDFLERLKSASSLNEFVTNIWPGVQSEKELRDAMEKLLHQQFESLMGECVQQFLIDADEALAIDKRLTKPAQDFIESWSGQLADLMHLNTNKEIERLLLESQEKARSIEQVADAIADSGIRSPGWRARRVAQTEVLRVESYAQLEYMRQDPSVEEKEWLHTGARKNKPRANHVAMNGKRVKVEEEFELDGADGKKHLPMCPRDICLPASETVNCHCIMRPIRNQEIMGMSVEERRALRKKNMDEVDAKWDIAHATDKVDMIKSMKREDQIKYFGGQDGGKQRMALIDSGVISTDKELERLYKIDADGKRVRKSLQELAEDGIFTVSDAALNHSTVGEFSGLRNPRKPASHKNGGNMKSGGHSQANIDELNRRGIAYKVEKTYDNGVRIGGVENHGEKAKRIDKTGQAWFPEDWDEDKVRAAGTFTANKPSFIQEFFDENGNLSSRWLFTKYDGVTIGIIMDKNSKIGTIFPDELQREMGI